MIALQRLGSLRLMAACKSAPRVSTDMQTDQCLGTFIDEVNNFIA